MAPLQDSSAGRGGRGVPGVERDCGLRGAGRRVRPGRKRPDRTLSEGAWMCRRAQLAPEPPVGVAELSLIHI